MTGDPPSWTDACPEDEPVPYTLTARAKAALATWGTGPADLAEVARRCNTCEAPASCSEFGRCPLDD